MAKKKLRKILKKIKKSAIGKENKKELLKMFDALKEEIKSLSETDAEHAKSIAAFSEISAYEATRKEKDPRLLKHAIGGLNSSVDDFEVSHPELVRIVNSISLMLSNIGI